MKHDNIRVGMDGNTANIGYLAENWSCMYVIQAMGVVLLMLVMQFTEPYIDLVKENC